MNKLLIDIGGTSIRFGCQSSDKDGVTNVLTLACEDFEGPNDAFQEYSKQISVKIDILVLALAAEITGPKVDITNNQWKFDASDLAVVTGASKYLLINDFTAQALSNVSLLGSKPKINSLHHVLLRKGNIVADAPLLIAGPGTGLGVAALLPSLTGPVVVDGEGGHVSYAPRNEVENNILQAMTSRFGHVSTERIVSGMGLELIHQIQNNIDLSAVEIGTRAIQGDKNCLDTVNLMLQSFATVVGNAALNFGAKAGVVISGGIIPKLVDLIDKSGFYERLEDHGRRSQFLSSLPIYLTIDPYAGLRGAAVAASSSQLLGRIKNIKA